MWKKTILPTHAYLILTIISVFTAIFFYIKVINVNTELDALNQDPSYVMIKVKENSITPKLSSVEIGNNGRLQIRGFAPSLWISEGQMSGVMFKDDVQIDKITCYAEGSFVTKSSVPFLCETNANNNGDGYYIKITKDYFTGEKGEAKEVIMPIKVENSQQ